MDLSGFKRTLASFADERTDLELQHGHLIVQIRDELIEATVTEEQGDIYVKEDDVKKRAFKWLITRVAKLPQLAGRIISHVAPEPHFITPAGKVLDHLERDVGDRSVRDVPSEVVSFVDKRPVGTSSVLYVTSDAGEGKTTVIDRVARTQAERYRSGQAKWLLLPMRLGGRSFLTFDDVVIAELVNRFRFQFFYYDAFLELVRLGVLVPAFDGFEEIFVEGLAGEAVSSLGNLVRKLDSSGSVVIAVRKAHFEYHSFRDRARVIDGLADVDASFARISIDRWDKNQFLEYGNRRGLKDATGVYGVVERMLRADHPVLTRAVLAKRLVDVAEENDLDKLLEKLGTAVGDYFYHFVNAIVEREVNEKWIDRSGVPFQALITVDEQHDLLSMVAKEMWITSSDSLSADYLELIAELFGEERSKPTPIIRQIANRLGQHSLIVVNGTVPPTYSFDHDDFRMFYWGEAIARMFVRMGTLSELGIYLGKRVLPDVAADAAVVALKRFDMDLCTTLRMITQVALADSSVSYVAENTAALVIRVLGALPDAKGIELQKFVFAPDAMKGKKINGAVFKDCSFSRTSLEGSTLTKSCFLRCVFEEIDLAGLSNIDEVKLQECSMGCVRDNVGSIYDPVAIIETLRKSGFSVLTEKRLEGAHDEPDELTKLAARALRTFLRATTVNQMTLEKRLGTMSHRFFRSVLPLMLERGVLKEVDYSGKGPRQRRFKLATSMQGIENALSRGKDMSLAGFLGELN